MKKYTDPTALQWDAWFVNRETPKGTQTHAFYLQNGSLTPQTDPRNGWGVGHAASYDSFHWENLPAVLPPLFDESNPMDFHSKFTGCAVNLDDVCYLFYTMRDRDRGSQRIGVAISRDWVNFEPWEGNPVVVNEDSRPIPVAGSDRTGTLIGFNNLKDYDWNIVDCRDFIVVEREDDGRGKYIGYYAAAADLGGSCPVGVIVAVRSHDLLHWTDPSIVYHVDHHGVLEVPDVFFMDGKWVLCCLSGMNYSGRRVTTDLYASNATIVAYADGPDGPFLEIEEDNILIAGPTQSGFTCRSFLRDGERHLVYIDRAEIDTSHRKQAMSLPKILRMDDDRLRVHYCPLPSEHVAPALPIEGWNNEQNSFAWRTFGGTTTWQDGTLTLRTAPKDYHPVSIPLPAEVAEDGAVMLQAKVQIHGNGGLFWRCRHLPYMLLWESGEGRVGLYRSYSFEPIAMRTFPVEEGRTYQLRCLLNDDVLELYVDDLLLLQCGLPTTHGLSHIGFVADRGELVASDIEINHLL